MSTPPAVGQKAIFLHPAGPVHGTISSVSPAQVGFTFQHADGNAVTLQFTQRANGIWLQLGKGKHNGQLVWAEAA